jgi:xanthosine utilization system XapX-like protein
MHRKLIGGVLLTAGVALGILWASGVVPHPFAPAMALLSFLAGASVFGRTSRFAARLEPWIGNTVRVQVWGSELPDASGSGFSLHKVLAVGPGLHFYLCPLPNGEPIHLKVAQPRGAIMGDTGLEIAQAKYVQWSGKMLEKGAGQKALTLVVLSSAK